MSTFKANIRHRGREYINSKLTHCAVGPPRGYTYTSILCNTEKSVINGKQKKSSFLRR